MASPQNGRTGTAPKLSYKYQRLREQLRTAIENGELSGHLPGERELARRYGANAKTLNKALNDLAIEGLLVRHVGRGTCVAKDLAEDPVLGKVRSFRWITPSGQSDAAFHRAVHLAQQHGHTLDLIDVHLDEQGEIPHRALSPGQLREVDGMILHAVRVSKPFLSDLLRRHIPFVMVDTLSEEATTNMVNPDYAHGAFELAEHLIGMGHRNLRLVLAQGGSPALRDARLGYETALRRHGLAVESALELHADGSEKDRAVLEHAFHAGHGASAALCAGHAVMRAMQACVHADLTLAAMHEPSAPHDVAASVMTYRYDLDRIVDWAMRILIDSAPAQRPQHVWVPGALHDYGSSAAPGTISPEYTKPREAVY